MENKICLVHRCENEGLLIIQYACKLFLWQSDIVWCEENVFRSANKHMKAKKEYSRFITYSMNVRHYQHIVQILKCWVDDDYLFKTPYLSKNWTFLAAIFKSFFYDCSFFPSTGMCSNKECPFLHVDPMSKVKDCPWYDRGFCKHGKQALY